MNGTNFSSNRMTQHSVSQIIRSARELARSGAQPGEIMKKGVRLFQSLPGFRYASLYLVNEETFELDLAETCPDSAISTSLAVYNRLLDLGVIGLALSSGEVQTCGKEDASGEVGLIFPLITATGVTGLIFLSVHAESETGYDESVATLELVCSLFGNVLVGRRHLIQLERSNEVLDQRVASRTIHLEESKHSLAAKFDHFRSSISMSMPHEVRTPLNHILGFSDYLLNSTGALESEENRDLLKDIKEAAERLSHLFENYIFYNNLNLIASNLESLNRLKNDSAHLSVQTLEYLVLSQPCLKDRLDDLEMHFADASVAMSENYFRKIVEELLSNCIKYSDPGSRVILETSKDETSLHLSFTDHGRGMSETQVKNIEAFMQFDRGVYEQQGAGLGIAIVSRIVDIYGGSLYVESVQGGYTIVRVRLPLTDAVA